MNTPGVTSSWLNGLVLAIIMALCLLLIGAVYSLTRDRIATHQAAEELAVLRSVLGFQYDNDPATDRLEIDTERYFDRPQQFTVYRARIEGMPAGVALAPITVPGYIGPIKLAIGIDREGVISGVLVLTHRETEGMGAEIHQDKSDWIEGFSGRSLDAPPKARWTVRGDEPGFDGISAATTSAEAVTKTVRQALEFYEANEQRLFE